MKACFDEAVGATDVGRRSHNEDTFLIRPELGLLLVADGVGGHLAGEVASHITCATISRELERGGDLVEAVRCANRDVMAAVETGDGKHGMATTVVAVQLHGAEYEVAWVGDSRAYLWDGQLKLLTRDHSLMEVLFARGQARREELRDHPQRNVIVQAVGLQEEHNLKVDTNRGCLRQGEILMLCSDGLSDILDNATIVELMTADGSLQVRCQRLVSRSIELGGKDNSTVVLVSGSATGASGPRPAIVWAFDPATGDTVYLNEDTADAAGAPAAQLAGAGGRERRTSRERSPQATQMMSIAEMERAIAAGRETSPGERQQVAGAGSGRAVAIGGALLAAAVAAAAAGWYFLAG